MVKRRGDSFFIILACPNSDGLTQFQWNHDGFWVGSKWAGTKDTKLRCAEDCIADSTCVAINYYYWGSKKGQCYHYRDRANLKKKNERIPIAGQLSKAYVLCSGDKLS